MKKKYTLWSYETLEGINSWVSGLTEEKEKKNLEKERKRGKEGNQVNHTDKFYI